MESPDHATDDPAVNVYWLIDRQICLLSSQGISLFAKYKKTNDKLFYRKSATTAPVSMWPNLMIPLAFLPESREGLDILSPHFMQQVWVWVGTHDDDLLDKGSVPSYLVNVKSWSILYRSWCYLSLPLCWDCCNFALKLNVYVYHPVRLFRYFLAENRKNISHHCDCWGSTALFNSPAFASLSW